MSTFIFFPQKKRNRKEPPFSILKSNDSHFKDINPGVYIAFREGVAPPDATLFRPNGGTQIGWKSPPWSRRAGCQPIRWFRKNSFEPRARLGMHLNFLHSIEPNPSRWDSPQSHFYPAKQISSESWGYLNLNPSSCVWSTGDGVWTEVRDFLRKENRQQLCGGNLRKTNQ